MNKNAEKLADLIEKNPNANFHIDNDDWWMTKSEKSSKEIATADSFAWQTDWYAHSSNYGAGVAEALVVLLNRRGFNITVSSV